MAMLINDHSFHYELHRMLAHARYRGSDTAEVLELASKIEPGDMESWHGAFLPLAQRTENSAGAPSKPHQASRRVTRADRLFAASNYYRAADFFLHGNPSDKRIDALWKKQTECFNEASKELGNGVRQLLHADHFDVPIIYFRTSDSTPGPPTRRPTIILGNGYDGAMEEMMHVSGFAALEREYNVILYEGPGQPAVRRDQGLGFIHDWERVVKPVVDFAFAQPDVDATKVALFGYSFGGILCVRAAAFEHRLAAAVAIDGIFDFNCRARLPDFLGEIWDEGKSEEFDSKFSEVAFDPNVPTEARWGFQQGMWSFNAKSGSDFMKKAEHFTLKDVIDKVHCPVFVGDAEEDLFFKGQPEKIAAALGNKGYHRRFSAAEGAGMHCQVGAAALMNGEVFDWLENTMVVTN
ncbi:hypothetical protein ACLMJK_002840 [Lecanora helva]